MSKKWKINRTNKKEVKLIQENELKINSKVATFDELIEI